MKKEIRSTLFLIVFLFLLWVLIYLSNNGVFSSSWIRQYVNGKEIVYRTPESFKNCTTLQELGSSGKELQKELSQEKLTKIQYLDTLFRAYCIDYSDISVSPDLEWEAKDNQKMVSKAIDLWILQSDSENPFQPWARITKIEALALLFRLTGIQVKNDLSPYNFRDVEDNWKRDVAAKATHLWLVYTSTKWNRFYPDRIMNQWDAYRMLKQISKYYR